jgi:glycosyltransferase involved in cell wall biosynthesis
MKFKKVILFNLAAGYNSADLSLNNNLWQIKHYENIAEKVYVIFLNHTNTQKIVRNGNTVLLSIGGESFLRDLFKAPFKLYKLNQKIKSDKFFTYEQVFLFWITIFFNSKTSIYQIPLTIPHLMYQITGKSLSYKIPIWIEKIFRTLSALKCTNVITSASLGEYITWLSRNFIYKRKLVVLNVFVEEIPSPYFLDKIKGYNYIAEDKHIYQALLVSRLKSEKCVDHAIKAISNVIENGVNIKLKIIGSGEELESLKELVKSLNLSNNVFFEGHKSLLEIADYYNETDVFLSPLTGSALREVAFFGLPVIAYEMDWLRGTLTNGLNYIGVESLNHKSLGEATLKLVLDRFKRIDLSRNIKSFAIERWGVNLLENEYKKLLK